MPHRVRKGETPLGGLVGSVLFDEFVIGGLVGQLALGELVLANLH